MAATVAACTVTAPAPRKGIDPMASKSIGGAHTSPAAEAAHHQQ